MKVDNHYTLVLITTSGQQHPIGIGGSPKFHVFNDWKPAHAAIADAVATVGLDSVLAIARTSVRRQGKRVEFNVTHISRDEVRELCQRSPNIEHRIQRRDGRSVRVSVPVDDHGDPSPSDGQL